ncbi:hypothetical protein Mgra_00007016 [Meloidogyne graminicola]|uniref:C2H2-type domain-containing protein n=1 Tax=Meloidogyne graminicola TaxID=189291 RepID=A0A8S9ZK19_9BILA|nr:hypothetical protein Mgra_00007016 [Meloidogyne graminicola]
MSDPVNEPNAGLSENILLQILHKLNKLDKLDLLDEIANGQKEIIQKLDKIDQKLDRQDQKQDRQSAKLDMLVSLSEKLLVQKRRNDLESALNLVKSRKDFSTSDPVLFPFQDPSTVRIDSTKTKSTSLIVEGLSTVGDTSPERPIHGSPSKSFCFPCDKQFYSEQVLKRHEKSPRHLDNIKRRRLDDNSSDTSAGPSTGAGPSTAKSQ